MHEDLWQGIDFKAEEAGFFLDKMGKVLVPRYRSDSDWHPSYSDTVSRWQPDFYFYLDAFLGAARSIPDVIQKCFGWDDHSTKDWPQPLADNEVRRRKDFQSEFTDLYRGFHRHDLSRIRVGTFHWTGMPSVQTKAKIFGGQEYTGRPGQLLPSAAPRRFPPGTDPAYLAIFSKPLPVEPQWEDFTIEIPQADGTCESQPLFSSCRDYSSTAQKLVADSKVLVDRIHGAAALTPPLAAALEKRGN